MKKNFIEEFNSKRLQKRKNISKKKFDVIKKETDLVWTDNDVALRVLLPFSARQLKIIDYALTEVKRQNIQSENDKLVIKTSDLIAFLHMKNGGSSYLDIEYDMKVIRDTSAWWRYDENDSKKKTLFSFFKDVDVVEGKKGTYTIQFKQRMLEKLNNIEPKIITDEKGNIEKIGFNFYPLLNVKDLKSKYSIVLYKICNVWKNAPRGYFERSLEAIKNDFLLRDYVDDKGKEHKYSFGYINNNCLIPAIKEINEKTDIYIKKIETYPNKKRVEKLFIYAYSKNESKLLKLAEQKEEERDEYFDTIENEQHEKSIDKAVKREEKRVEARAKERIIRNYEKMQEQEKTEQEQKEFDEVREKVERFNVEIEKIKNLSFENLKIYVNELASKDIEERIKKKVEKYEKETGQKIYLQPKVEQKMEEIRQEVLDDIEEEKNKKKEEKDKKNKELIQNQLNYEKSIKDDTLRAIAFKDQDETKPKAKRAIEKATSNKFTRRDIQIRERRKKVWQKQEKLQQKELPI